MAFLLVLMIIAQPAVGNDLLPQWMTAEEMLRVDEIGKGHVITTPPGCRVETPGEFECLCGVFVTWRYGYGSGQDVIFREIVREVVEVTKTFIIVRSSNEQNNVSAYLTNGGVLLDSVSFSMYPNNSIWSRDYGPWFMRKEDNGEGIVDFQYNRPRPSDDTIPWRIGTDWGIPVYGSPLEHPGGNFMVDGLGTGFASNLIYDENSGYSAQEIDSLMLVYCGLEQFIVLPKINSEYTGHIDLWTKVLNDTLVLVGEYAAGHPNHNLLNQNAALIASFKNREGINYRIARIPMPWSTSNAPPHIYSFLIAPGVSVTEKLPQKPWIGVSVFPNPAYSHLFVSFCVVEETEVKVEIYNILGQRVKQLQNAYTPGYHTITWDLCGERNHRLASGVYFYSVHLGVNEEKGKILVVR